MKLHLVVLGCLAASAALSPQMRQFNPADVSVITTDYAFSGIPTTLAPGATLFSMENKGSVRHEMSMILLRPGVDVQQVVDSGVSPTSKKTAEKLIGLLIARPGESAGGKLYVELHAGERYLVICSLKDAPSGPAHSKLGMLATFVVSASH